MTTAVQIGEAARDRADFRRCFKTGAAVFLHDDGIIAHSTHRNTPRAASPPPLSSPKTGVTERSQDIGGDLVPNGPSRAAEFLALPGDFAYKPGCNPRTAHRPQFCGH